MNSRGEKNNILSHKYTNTKREDQCDSRLPINLLPINPYMAMMQQEARKGADLLLFDILPTVITSFAKRYISNEIS